MAFHRQEHVKSRLAELDRLRVEHLHQQTQQQQQQVDIKPSLPTDTSSTWQSAVILWLVIRNEPNSRRNFTGAVWKMSNFTEYSGNGIDFLNITGFVQMFRQCKVSNRIFAGNVFGFFVQHFWHQHTIKNTKTKINELRIWHTATWRWVDDDW